MRTIYLDVLLLCSLYMNDVLLHLTARLTHSRLTWYRALLSAGLGSFSSLLILVPPLPFALSLLCKAGTAALLCWMAFGAGNGYVWKLLSFLGLSCLVAGGLLALMLSGGSVYYANGCWYPDISLKVLLLGTIAAYLVLSLVQRLRDRQPNRNYQVHIRYREHVTMLKGLADTGNTLTDFLTGQPVIICGREQLREMLPETFPAKGFRPLPCTTVTGEGLLMVFHPDEVVIASDKTSKKVDALIGLSEQQTQNAIFHPKLLY